MIFRKAIAKTQARLSDLGERLQEAERGLAEISGQVPTALQAYTKSHFQRYALHLERVRQESAKALSRAYLDYGFAPAAGWEDDGWKDWAPDRAAPLPKHLRVGNWTETGEDGARMGQLPAMIPFLGSGHCYVVKCDGSTEDAGKRLLQALAARLALLFPKQSRFHFLDPMGQGGSFRLARHIPDARILGDDLTGELRALRASTARLIQQVVPEEGFHSLPEETRFNEKFEFLFAADFPQAKAYQRAYDDLATLARVGPNAGRYAFILWNTGHPLPHDLKLAEFGRPLEIDLREAWLDPVIRPFHASGIARLAFAWDEAPSENRLKELLARSRTLEAPKTGAGPEGGIALPERDWWKEDSRERIATPIGTTGGRAGDLEVVLGAKRDGSECVHGLIGGTSGGGKSNTLHALILGLATRYSPRELKVYLVDMKRGVEFNCYADLPHVEVLTLNATPRTARSVLGQLQEETRRRLRILESSGVLNYAQYRAKGEPKGPLPRILAIFDEYQALFEGDDQDQASTAILELSRQTRAAGIHLILSTQDFVPPGLRYRDSILNNFHLRMAMWFGTGGSLQGLSEFSAFARSQIAAFDRPGKILFNDSLGSPAADKVGSVAYLAREAHTLLVGKLAAKAKAAGLESRPLVFNGTVQPSIRENPWLSAALRSPLKGPDIWTRVSSLALTDARATLPAASPADRPIPVWLGKDMTLFGHTAAILKRKRGQHIALVGGDAESQAMVLAACLESLFLSGTERDVRLYVVDAFPGGSPMLKQAWECVQAAMARSDVPCRFLAGGRPMEDLLGEFAEESKRRSGSVSPGSDPARLLFLIAPDRERALQRPADSLRAPAAQGGPGETLRHLLAHGSRLGLHLFLACDSFAGLSEVIDERRELAHISHRIAFQMGQEDSRKFLGNYTAARLDSAGEGRLGAYFDAEQGGGAAVFRPYHFPREAGGHVAG